MVAGTGGVSITGLILAKAAGATTIITSSSDEKLQLVKDKYGPDYVINYKTTPDWAAEAKKITGGRGVDHVFENGGSGTIKQSIDCITMGGIISVIGFLSDAKQEECRMLQVWHSRRGVLFVALPWGLSSCLRIWFVLLWKGSSVRRLIRFSASVLRRLLLLVTTCKVGRILERFALA